MQMIRICHMKAVIALIARGNSPAKGCEQGYSALARQGYDGEVFMSSDDNQDDRDDPTTSLR